jgi:hypothetical protein
MKPWVLRLLATLAVAALAIWLWRTFFPGPEFVLRKNLKELAAVASFGPKEAPLAKLSNVEKLCSFFAPDAEIRIEIQGYAPQMIKGKDDIFQKAGFVRQYVATVQVDFLDTIISLAPDRQTAVANLTAKIKVSGDRDFYPQELKFTFQKIGGKWLIIKVETVKTLGQAIEFLKDREVAGIGHER